MKYVSSVKITESDFHFQPLDHEGNSSPFFPRAKIFLSRETTLFSQLVISPFLIEYFKNGTIVHRTDTVFIYFF